ncbi:GNAT family N-acetyltransferase [Sorangium sp. So ce394]|uniref:GNAT family N-acetyltransferase n=1 Tax=Sorangium sp. So ce394 TaxID=3133310 RepID=UPI003F5B2128
MIGERVVLRALEPADEEAFLTMNRESEAFHAPWTASVRSPADLTAYRARCLSPSFEGWIVVRREDGALVGAVTLSEMTRTRACVGFQVGVAFARRGYMTEALGLVCLRARALGLARLDASIQPSNEAAIALVEKLGFRRSPAGRRLLRVAGAWVDHGLWTVTLISRHHGVEGPA